MAGNGGEGGPYHGGEVNTEHGSIYADINTSSYIIAYQLCIMKASFVKLFPLRLLFQAALGGHLEVRERQTLHGHHVALHTGDVLPKAAWSRRCSRIFKHVEGKMMENDET